MPKVTIWIRQSDLEAWQSIKDRPGAIAWLIEQQRKRLKEPKGD